VKKSLPLCSAIAILSAVCSPGQTPPPLRVMPLGDSITHGAHASGEPDAGGYRYPLYVALTNAGYNVDYIGTMTTVPHPGLGAEIHHEGHSGWRIVGGNNLYDNILTWLSQIEDPDVVLVHIGTNDSGDDDFTNRVDRLDDLVTRIATARPYAHIVVTTLLKRGGSDSDARYVAIANHFNPFVEQKVLAQQALGRRVHFLDMHAYLERTDMYDNLHPNPTGYAKMAAAWFPAVTNIVGPCGDRLPPGLSSVKAVSAATLTVTFSKPLDLAASPAVTNPASYAVSPAGSVTAVSLLSSDLRKVTLSLSGLTPNVTGTLSFNGTVTDLIPAAEGGPYSAVLSGPAGTFVTPAASGYAAENLPAGTLDGWEPLYTLNIPNGVRYGYSPVGYALDTSANYANLPLSRVAYYLALQRVDEPLRYVWVELDAFTQEAAKLGVPTTLSGAFFQQTVSNLIVLSTSPTSRPAPSPSATSSSGPATTTRRTRPPSPAPAPSSSISATRPRTATTAPCSSTTPPRARPSSPSTTGAAPRSPPSSPASASATTPTPPRPPAARSATGRSPRTAPSSPPKSCRSSSNAPPRPSPAPRPPRSPPTRAFRATSFRWPSPRPSPPPPSPRPPSPSTAA
jgi:lysophospholipase L1-like esterase